MIAGNTPHEGGQRRLLVMKSKQLALLTPVYWDLEREAHQLLGGKLRRVLAVDDGGDNVRRQQRQTQQSGYVTRRDALLAWR